MSWITPFLRLFRKAAPGLTVPASQHISPEGIALVKHFESLFLRAYRDPVGVWTIGYGHTGLVHQDGTVKAGRVITEAEAEDLLRHDMESFERDVSRLVAVPLRQCEFDALVSFAFNCGAGNLGNSTLLKKLNAGDKTGAADEFGRWNKAGGKVLAGLTRRRNAERALFKGGDWRAFRL